MAFQVFPVARVSWKVLALFLAVGLVATAASMGTASAGSGEPASKMLKRIKQGANGTAPVEKKVSRNWSGTGEAGAGKATTETGIVSDGSVSPFLTADSPAGMDAALARYEQIVASGGWPSVPSGKMTKGSTGKAVAALNQRLFVEGYLRKEATEGEFRETFTSATEDAVSRFQRYHGLAVTGSVDNATLRELNVPVGQRLATLRANVPRIAEYSKDLGERYMVVNVPAMQIETVNNGRVYSRHNAIVGRPSRPTPVVMTPLTIVRFNPYWNAPPSIVEKDILPRMMSSGPSKVMREMNMKIFKGVGGPEVNPDSVNWRRVRVDDYHFRQEPGGSNAMATAKIEFNSPHGIYLHDTPEPQLFAHGQRFYSSGCVRVEKVAILIDWILQGQDGIDRSRISELAETKDRLDETIANAPQLRVAYLTAWPTRDGVAAFRPDIYEMDGTGFVVGQPLPPGEKIAGQRYVLKPIARSAAAVDEAEAFGFASLFRGPRNPDKQEAGAISRSRGDDDTLFKRKPKAGEKTTVSDKKGGLFNWTSTKTEGKTKRKAVAASAKKKKLATATKDDSKKKAAKSVKADEKKKAASDKKQANASCKAGSDGKLPAGCKAAVKKPVAKPEKTASAAN
ncbi:MAG: L,D-transpeptidase family protein [Alphaproteobacteria bacterium]|nr:L,D-transpeptidase family protein [Alphaproteobacteria bacterium]